MNERTRKTLAAAVAAAALLAGLFLCVSVLSGYGHTVPVVLGPYKKAALALLGLVFVLAAGAYARPLNKQTIFGSLGIALGVFWFTGRMLLAYRSPESAWLFRMDQWMPLPLMAAGAGIALWIGELLPAKTFRITEKGQLLLVLLLMFICLQPALDGGFSWDDAFFSVEAQYMRVSGESIFRRVWQEIVEYVRIGRINPFATFHYLVFYFIPSAAAYKLLLVGLTLLCGFLFYRYLRLWEGEARPALMGLLIVPLCFQLRLYHDPLNSYYGLMQVMFCELMGSLILFVRWLREGKKRCLVFSLLFFAMGLMSYEMFFPLTALFLIPALVHEKRLLPAIRRALPHILLAVLVFGVSMLLRRNITDETAYSGTTFALDLKAIFTALWLQIRAAFPLSYRTAGYDAVLFGGVIPWREIFNCDLGHFIAAICWQDLLACVILAVVVNQCSAEKAKFSGLKALFGLLLWILPGLVISLSAKYQRDLYPGVAYIPVFFSYFGAAMLLYELAALAGRFMQRRNLRLICTGIGCAVLLITLQDNRAVSQRLNGMFLYPRSVGEAALQAGILDENVGEDQLVVSDVPYSLWEHGWQMEPHQSRFYSLNARREIRAVGVRDYVAAQDPETGWLTAENTVLNAYSGDEQEGFAKSGRLRGTGFDFESGSLSYPMVTDVFIFVSGKNENGAVLIYETRDAEMKRIPVEDTWLVRKTDAGSLYKLQEGRPILFDTICVTRQ